jgi:hypothetical protein
MWIYHGVNRYTRSQFGVTIWIHESISNIIECYKFWNDRILETRLKIHRGHITILRVYVPTEGREELSEEVYETLKKISDK